MNISPIKFSNCCYKANRIKNNSLNFGSICADANNNNESDYGIYTLSNPDFCYYKQFSTRIFRDLPSQIAIAKMLNLNPKQKSQIKILGCSDGSEAWAYAIVLQKIMGQNAKNVTIQAIDKESSLIEIAKTGCIVLSDIEHDYAQGKTAIFKEKSPIAYDGWNKYLTETKRPKIFSEILKKHPYMRFYENDPIVNKKIGQGLNWYKINQEGLPKISFECGDMFDYLEPDKEAQNVIYVMANSSGYILGKNPCDFLNLFGQIKERNKGKKVFIALGNIEYNMLNLQGFFLSPHTQLNVNSCIEQLGFKKIPEYELANFGIKDNYVTSKKIYKLEQ